MISSGVITGIQELVMALKGEADKYHYAPGHFCSRLSTAAHAACDVRVGAPCIVKAGRRGYVVLWTSLAGMSDMCYHSTQASLLHLHGPVRSCAMSLLDIKPFAQAAPQP